MHIYHTAACSYVLLLLLNNSRRRRKDLLSCAARQLDDQRPNSSSRRRSNPTAFVCRFPLSLSSRIIVHLRPGDDKRNPISYYYHV